MDRVTAAFGLMDQSTKLDGDSLLAAGHHL
jgi:hypothetical protein